MKLHLSQFPHQRWDTIIIQNDLMHPMELLFLIAIQRLLKTWKLIRFTKQPAQGLTDLALNPNGNVFLDEVFHHSEVVLCPSHFFEDTFSISIRAFCSLKSFELSLFNSKSLAESSNL